MSEFAIFALIIEFFLGFKQSSISEQGYNENTFSHEAYEVSLISASTVRQTDWKGSDAKGGAKTNPCRIRSMDIFPLSIKKKKYSFFSS